MDRAIDFLRDHFGGDVVIKKNAPMSLYTTLQAGGPARYLVEVNRLETLAKLVATVQTMDVRHVFLGSGSNVLPSDKGIDALVIINGCARIDIGEETYAETGCWFQDLFLKAAQHNRTGLEFAVGIPGTLGGALVSNAGAYRANIADRLSSIEIVRDGVRKWVPKTYLEFSYRDSILRRNDPPSIALLSVRLDLPIDNPKTIYDRARDYQRQRIMKQPPHASAGSFFKNVNDHRLAQEIEGLTDGMRASGVVPAGFLMDACGLKGASIGRAQITTRHANYLCNLGGATASDIRALAEHAKSKVRDRFGVELEEEVLYIGDWDEAA
jgi:UDP-N-acetylmuramate dehydrogenase